MKEVVFVGSALSDWKAMPADVQDSLGYGLHLLQLGQIPPHGKPFKGCGSGTWELRDDYQTDTYRAICVVRFKEAVYVLHCFQKKSKRGREIPREEMVKIQARLRSTLAMREERYGL